MALRPTLASLNTLEHLDEAEQEYVRGKRDHLPDDQILDDIHQFRAINQSNHRAEVDDEIPNESPKHEELKNESKSEEPLSSKPSLEEFLSVATKDNPNTSERDLKQYWNDQYGHLDPNTLPTLEDFLPAAKADNPKVPESKLKQYWDDNYGVFGAREKDPGDLGRGFKESFQQLPQLGYGLVAGAGAAAEKMVGEGGLATAIKDAGVKGYQRWSEEIAKETKPSDSIAYAYTQATEHGNLGAFIDWMQHAFSYTGGQVLQMLPTAGVGSVAGKLALQPLAKSVAERMVTKEAATLAATAEGSTLAQEELIKAATAKVAGRIGSLTAVGTQATGMEGGEIFGELTQQADQEGRPLNGTELAKAFGSTLAAGGLEFVGDKLGLDVILGRSPLNQLGKNLTGVKGRVLRGTVEGAALAVPESATEFAQTLVEKVGEGQDPFADPSIREAIDSAALGAVGGASMGGAAGVITPSQKPVPKREPDIHDIPDAVGVDRPEVGIDDAIQGAYNVVDSPVERQKTAAKEEINRLAILHGERLPTAEEAARFGLAQPRPGIEIPVLKGPTPVGSELWMQEGIEPAIQPGHAFTPRSEPTPTAQERIAAERAKIAQLRRPKPQEEPTSTPAPQENTPLKTVQEIAYPESERSTLPTQRTIAKKEPIPKRAGQEIAILEKAAPSEQPAIQPVATPTPRQPVDPSPKEAIVSERERIVAMRERARTAREMQIPKTGEAVEREAHQAATSPKNALPQPSEKQIESGVYKKGHVRINGLDISIENPVGSERSGVDKNGKPWSQVMQQAHYGYIRSIRSNGEYLAPKSKDREHVDIFLPQGTPEDYNGPVFVIDQKHPDTGIFDEHKAVLAQTEQEAKHIYLSNYGKDWKGLRSIKRFTMPEFKLWLEHGNKQKPVNPIAEKAPIGKEETATAPIPPVTPNGIKKDIEKLKSAKQPATTSANPKVAEPRSTAVQATAPDTGTAPRQTEIPVLPETVGTRPIIGRDATPEEAPLFSKAAQIPAPIQPALPMANEATKQPEENQSPNTILANALRSAADKIEGKIQDVGEKIGGARKDLSEKTGPKPKMERPAEEVPSWRKRYSIGEIVSEGPEKGKWQVRDTKDTDFAGRARAVGKPFDTKEAAEAAIPLIAVSRNHRVYKDRDGKYTIYRKIGDRKIVQVVGQKFDTEEDAKRYMALHAKEILETKTNFGEEILPRPETVERIGADRRNGRNVEAEDFRKTFDFRAVEFGNWNNQIERQEVMNHAYEGLLDLADVLGIPPQAIGLNGQLALAFGARGHGLSGARAHYETDYGVINLTKMKGAGSLAHEWFHAADHYFGRQDTKASSEKEANERGDLVYKGNQSPSQLFASHGFRSKELSGVRPEVREAYKNLIQTMFTKGERYVEDTEKADRFVAEAKNDVIKSLQSIRDTSYYALSKQIVSDYHKRNKEPATAAQLAEFDTIAQQIINGDLLETTYKLSENKTRHRLASGRWTNDALEKISAIYKAVRGRSGFGSGKIRGPLDELRGYMDRYSQRLKMLADAQTGEQKTKQVPTSYAIEAKSIDQGRTEHYWTTEHEMSARAFSAYVEDKLKAEGKKSDFITYQTYGAVETPWGWKHPYPEGEERQAINTAFDKLFDTMDTKETEQGTALFSRAMPSSEDTQKIAALNAEIERREGIPNAFTWSPRGDQGVIDAFKNVFNITIIPITTNNERAKAFHSMQYRDRLFVDTDTHKGFVQLSGHELLHQLRRDEPELYAWFAQNAEHYLRTNSERDYGARLEATGTDLHGTDVREEILADFTGDALSDPFFLTALAEHNPSKFRQLLNTVLNWLRSVANKLTDAGLGSSLYFDHVEGLQSYLANVLNAYRHGGTEAIGEVESVKYARDLTQPPAKNQLTGEQGGIAYQLPTMSKLDDVIRLIQDKNIDLVRLVDAIKAAKGPIADDLNPVLKEELYLGRVAKLNQDFLTDELKPLVDQMRFNNIEIKDLDTYLHARHAKEANAYLKSINPDREDNNALSGMTDAHAETILKDASPVMAKLAHKVDGMLKKTRQLMVDYGVESQQTVDGWAAQYQHYVPLYREGFAQRMGTGQGRSIRGSSVKERTGSTRGVEDILAHIAMDREKIIVRGEKMRPVIALAGLLKQHPNPEIATLAKPTTLTYHDPETGLEVTMPGNFGEYHVPTIAFVNKQTGKVEHRPDPAYQGRENVVNFRLAGVDHAIVFNEHNERAMEMARGLKDLDVGQLNTLLSAVAPVTRYLAAISTQYNPVFGVTNLVRDAQFAMLSLSSTPLAGRQKEVLSAMKASLSGIYKDARAIRRGEHPSSPTAQLWERFQRVGGPTGYRDLFRTSQDRAKAIQQMLDPDWWQKTGAGKFITAGGYLSKPASILVNNVGRPIFQLLSDYNLSMENAVRLGVFKAGIEHGMSDEQAASAAKGVTVNFNRRGTISAQAGALYAFFNASVQGTARMAETLFEKGKFGKLSPIGKRIIAGGLTLGALQTFMLAMTGFGENDPPEWLKSRSLVIPVPGTDKGYISIPMPLGFNVIPSLGRLAAETLIYGHPLDKSSKFMNAMVDVFSPVGGSASPLQVLAPSVVDPLVALSENRDWTGKSIYREDFDKLHPTPGMSRAKDSATPWARGLAEVINYALGGTAYTPGLLSPTPDSIDFLIGSATGGLGREVSKLAKGVTGLMTGETTPLHTVPLVGRFVGTAGDQSAIRNRFYENLRTLNIEEAEVKGRRQNREDVSEYVRDHPEVRLARMAERLQHDISNLEKRKRDAVKSGNRERVKLMEMQIAAMEKRLNDRVEELVVK